MIESIATDIEVHPKKEIGDLLYSLYLDDPMTIGVRPPRFASGILVDRKGADKKKTLLGMNDVIRQRQISENDDLPAYKLWECTTYESTLLPRVDAAVVQFPFTDGIVSALVLSYRVRPMSKMPVFYIIRTHPIISAADHSRSSQICRRTWRERERSHCHLHVQPLRRDVYTLCGTYWLILLFSAELTYTHLLSVIMIALGSGKEVFAWETRFRHILGVAARRTVGRLESGTERVEEADQTSKLDGPLRLEPMGISLRCMSCWFEPF